ncbi:class I SAM-dependent methyltransferase [Nocardia sp. 2]|uniref:Class I SAM-dependent methyltransferase n=1 Tax=Nocardia acididurans TaxID=2802282 RepID=A0ABS1LXN3_9NOCA|nr:class I SAM-dependent methyltransferase [Nocardia acididurans]MBL1073128.1 class I SAM-dependent methyltransferase [Nocardia acididurans]
MTSTSVTEAEKAGAAVYSARLLPLYDFYVLRLSNSLIWRCSTRKLLANYDAYTSADHLDIGPGSGWFLRATRFPVADPRVTLVDLNPASLEMTTQRLLARGVEPQCRVASVLQPLQVDRRFGSVAANLLMHCVPGGWTDKGAAFKHIAGVTAADGVFFGSTVLAHGVRHNFLARRLISFYNRSGTFHNADDDLAGLELALRDAFADVQIRVIGSMATWVARSPRAES